MNPRKILRLHIGCGHRNFGRKWVHIDKGNFDHVQLHNVEELPFPDNSVNIIYSSHMIEYYSELEVISVLSEWKRVLKPNGIIRLAVPDFNAMAQLYSNKRFGLDSFLGPLFGEISIPGFNDSIYHRVVYDFNTISSLLYSVGFHNVNRYNWRRTEHAEFDDCSQAYLPKMDKVNGCLISLNVQANKTDTGINYHGMAGTKTYRSWASMVQRCTNVNHPRYCDWGGRGIVLEDERWAAFANFFNDMGECPKWGSLDRKNNEIGYSKKNCRWADLNQQSNNRRTTKFIEYKGEIKSLKEWCVFLGLNYSTIQGRIITGWSAKDAFETVIDTQRLLTYNGQTKRLSEFAKDIGLDWSTVAKRIGRGWSIEKTLNTPLI